mmetsp:Transcript_33881/g.85050  ORF Transcript_33881/g.85050 Transcript_33881/m.85050 type:complete len:377 (+) Transcript_33881:307-1437(+)
MPSAISRASRVRNGTENWWSESAEGLSGYSRFSRLRCSQKGDTINMEPGTRLAPMHGLMWGWRTKLMTAISCIRSRGSNPMWSILKTFTATFSPQYVPCDTCPASVRTMMLPNLMSRMLMALCTCRRPLMASSSTSATNAFVTSASVAITMSYDALLCRHRLHSVIRLGRTRIESRLCPEAQRHRARTISGVTACTQNLTHLGSSCSSDAAWRFDRTYGIEDAMAVALAWMSGRDRKAFSWKHAGRAMDRSLHCRSCRRAGVDSLQEAVSMSAGPSKSSMWHNRRMAERREDATPAGAYSTPPRDAAHRSGSSPACASAQRMHRFRTSRRGVSTRLYSGESTSHHCSISARAGACTLFVGDGQARLAMRAMSSPDR